MKFYSISLWISDHRPVVGSQPTQALDSSSLRQKNNKKRDDKKDTSTIVPNNKILFGIGILMSVNYIGSFHNR